MRTAISIITPTRKLGTADAFQRGMNAGAWSAWRTLKGRGYHVWIERRWCSVSGRREAWLFADLPYSYSES